MRNGPLRHRISLQQLAVAQDPDSGEELPQAWVEWAKPWARIEPLSARELIAAQAAHSEVSGRIVIRHRDGVVPTMRIVYRGKVYSIHGVLPDTKSGLEYLTLLVSEGVRDG